MIDMLYQNGFLRTISKQTFNATEVFWESFEHSLNLNKRGANGKQRILSIIADKFPYKELQTRLHVNILCYLWIKFSLANSLSFYRFLHIQFTMQKYMDAYLVMDVQLHLNHQCEKKLCLKSMKINLNGL